MSNKLPAITLTIEAGVARIALDRPATGNGMGVDFVDAIDAVTLELSERDDVRAVVLSSTGKRFCVGGDIDDMQSARGDLTLAAYIRKCNAKVNASIARLQHMAAPSLAVVQGVVAGGGVSMVAGFDIVLCSDNARFVAAYPSIGFCPDLGGTTMLSHRVGVARARRFYLLHEQLDAATAERIGLADIVVKPEELAASAESIVQRWATGPTAAYAEIRRLMRSAPHTSLEAQMELETQSLAKLTKTADSTEALNAFLEKRTPTFRGR